MLVRILCVRLLAIGQGECGVWRGREVFVKLSCMSVVPFLHLLHRKMVRNLVERSVVRVLGESYAGTAVVSIPAFSHRIARTLPGQIEFRGCVCRGGYSPIRGEDDMSCSGDMTDTVPVVWWP